MIFLFNFSVRHTYWSAHALDRCNLQKRFERQWFIYEIPGWEGEVRHTKILKLLTNVRHMCYICKTWGGKIRLFGHKSFTGWNCSGRKGAVGGEEAIRTSSALPLISFCYLRASSIYHMGIIHTSTFLFLCVLCCVVNTAIKPEAPWWDLKFTQGINSLKVPALKCFGSRFNFSMSKSFAPGGRRFNLQMSSNNMGTPQSKVCTGETIFWLNKFDGCQHQCPGVNVLSLHKAALPGTVEGGRLADTPHQCHSAAWKGICPSLCPTIECPCDRAGWRGAAAKALRSSWLGGASGSPLPSHAKPWITRDCPILTGEK